MRRQKAYWYLLWLLPILTICLTAWPTGRYHRFQGKDGYFYYKQDKTIYRIMVEKLYQGEENISNGKEKNLSNGEAVLAVQGGSL